MSRDPQSPKCQQKRQFFRFDFMLWYFEVSATLLPVFNSVLLLTMMCFSCYFSASTPDLTPTLCLVTEAKWLWLERSNRAGASHKDIQIQACWEVTMTQSGEIGSSKVPLSFSFLVFFFPSGCPQGYRHWLICAAKQTSDVISSLHKVFSLLRQNNQNVLHSWLEPKDFALFSSFKSWPSQYYYLS